MYKGKPFLWAFILAIAFFINSIMSGQLSKFLKDFFTSESMYINASINSDSEFSYKLNHNTMYDCQVISAMKEDASIIISDSDEKDIDGFTKISDAIYSPLVVFASSKFTTDTQYMSGFSAIDGKSNSRSPYRINLYNILLGMEEGKNWEDIGYNPKYLKGEIVLYIPDESSVYYSKVVDLFYITLNGGKYPSDAIRKQLSIRVDGLLNKCVKVMDIAQDIRESVNSKTNNLYIAPEYLYLSYSDVMGRYESNYRPVYMYHTVSLYLDMYIDETKTTTTQFYTRMKNENTFMKETGWRVTGYTYNINKVDSIFALDVFDVKSDNK